jgi:transcriptional regulator with XRE-family HTH domain
MGTEKPRTRSPRKPVHPAFGRRVRELRKIKFPDTPIHVVAKMAGISGPYLSNIELGKVPPPSLGTVIELVSVLDADFAELARLSGHMKHGLHQTTLSNDGKVLKPPPYYFADSLAKIMQLSAMSQMGIEDLMSIVIGKFLQMGKKPETSDMIFYLEDLAADLRPRLVEMYQPGLPINDHLIAGRAALRLCREAIEVSYQLGRISHTDESHPSPSDGQAPDSSKSKTEPRPKLSQARRK